MDVENCSDEKNLADRNYSIDKTPWPAALLIPITVLPPINYLQKLLELNIPLDGKTSRHFSFTNNKPPHTTFRTCPLPNNSENWFVHNLKKHWSSSLILWLQVDKIRPPSHDVHCQIYCPIFFKIQLPPLLNSDKNLSSLICLFVVQVLSTAVSSESSPYFPFKLNLLALVPAINSKRKGSLRFSDLQTSKFSKLHFLS